MRRYSNYPSALRLSNGNQIPFSRHEKRIRVLLAALTGTPLFIAWLYTQGWESQIIHCYFQNTFGIISPGCGLTRSIVFFLQGRTLESIKYHLFGPIIFLLAGFIFSWSLISLVTRKSLALEMSQQQQALVLSLFSGILSFSFLSYYCLRCFALYGQTFVPQIIQNSSIWSFLVSGSQLL